MSALPQRADLLDEMLLVVRRHELCKKLMFLALDDHEKAMQFIDCAEQDGSSKDELDLLRESLRQLLLPTAPWHGR